MSRNTRGTVGISPAVQESLVLLGGNLRLCRKRRKMPLSEFAERLFVDEKTVRRLEQGEPGVSVGLLAEALELFSLPSLDKLAEPDQDSTGALLEKSRLERVQRVRKSADDNLDF